MNRYNIFNITASLRRSLTLITMAGSLAMVYVTGITCPATIEFFYAIGAKEIHFGLFGGIPMVMLFMQFVGAVMTNHIQKRKTPFMVLIILSRLLYIPIAFIPILFPSLGKNVMLATLIFLTAVSGALMNLASPLWYSWMADVIPHRVLNSYWGNRERWMNFTWAASFLIVTAFTYFVNLPITVVFPILIVVAVTAGISDILLFIWVDEPQNTIMRGKSILELLLAPLRHAEYKTFVLFSCARTTSIMFAAAFMQLYVLKVLGLVVWQATLIWCISGVGTAFAANHWGRIADRHGHKPVLAICMFFKPVIVAVFLIMTSSSALWILPVAFLIDGVWNAGIVVAANGYMMKIAPRQNRSMFIAAILGLSGICGGVGAIAGGSFLEVFSNFSFTALGRNWNNYHLLFLVAFFMRAGCAVLVHWVREPKSSKPVHVLSDLLGVWPMRFLRFPVGLYRKNMDAETEKK